MTVFIPFKCNIMFRKAHLLFLLYKRSNRFVKNKQTNSGNYKSVPKDLPIDLLLNPKTCKL